MEMTYKLAPKLPFASRLAAALVLAAAGVAVQFLASPVLGFPLVLAGGLAFLANSYTNKPKDLGFEDWRPVTDREIDRITDNLRQSRKIRLPAYFSRGMAIAVAIVLLAIAFFSGVIAEDGSFSMATLDALAFIGPILFSGSVSVWVPAELKMKMECFQSVLSRPRPEGTTITPYLRFDKNKEGKEIPEDVRLMLEAKRRPEDFVGIQLQAAINSGEHGAVPYLYAVCLTKGKGPSFKKLAAMRIDGYEIEWKEPEEYGAVVVRQETSGGGYFTSGEDCARLYQLCLKILDFSAQGA